jgi:hypothetical protein
MGELFHAPCPRTELTGSCHDLTVPFPTAAISAHDPFAEYETTPFPLDLDENHIVRGWIAPAVPDAAGPCGGDGGDDETEQLHFQDNDIQIAVTIQHHKAGAGAMALRTEHRRPVLPPILYARYPFTYVSC